MLGRFAPGTCRADGPGPLTPDVGQKYMTPISNVSLIKKPLWDAARWRGTAFFVTPGFTEQPGIGLQFEDYDAGVKIFDDWKKTFCGFADKHHILRISIIRGKHPSGRVGYALNFTTDVSDIPPAPSKEEAGLIYVEARHRFHETGGNYAALDGFVESWNKHKRYFVVPVPMQLKGGLDPYLPHSIVKGRLYLREFSSVEIDDLDGVTLE